MEGFLNPKAFLAAISELEDALKKDDPHFIRRAAEAVIAARDEFFGAARNLVAGMTRNRE